MLSPQSAQPFPGDLHGMGCTATLERFSATGRAGSRLFDTVSTILFLTYVSFFSYLVGGLVLDVIRYS